MTELITEKQIREAMKLSCDLLNPILLVSILSEVPTTLSLSLPQYRKQVFARAIQFCITGCIAIAIPVVLAELGKKHEVWSGHPGFPSGHTTFAAAASASIVAYRGNYWLMLGVPCTALMMVALVYLKYHDVPEVFGGLALGWGLSTAITRLLIRPVVSQPSNMPVEE